MNILHIKIRRMTRRTTLNIHCMLDLSVKITHWLLNLFLRVIHLFTWWWGWIIVIIEKWNISLFCLSQHGQFGIIIVKGLSFWINYLWWLLWYIQQLLFLSYHSWPRPILLIILFKSILYIVKIKFCIYWLHHTSSFTFTHLGFAPLFLSLLIDSTIHTFFK